MNDNRPIIPAATAIETMRDSGYKDVSYALAELIDNSIEAQAKNIQVLTFDGVIEKKRKTDKVVTKIAVYDDGKGMDQEVLGLALQFGVGTRMNTRHGIGRFGIGLPNASISQCKKVTVYSWKNNICYKTYLDIDEVKETKSQNANPVMKCEMPQELEFIDGQRKDSGTLVVWEKCDRLGFAKSITLLRRMENSFCRIYRHFLDDDDSYGTKVDIKVIAINLEKDRKIDILKANDPLYLLTPNNVPNYEDKATNSQFADTIILHVPYDNEGNTSQIEIRFSIALPETQKLGGSSAVGKHYEKNTGISFVRAGREIDFGSFGFFNRSEPRERWFGCEVRFEPILDEIFGVTNNKQSIRKFRKLDTEERSLEHVKEEIEDDPVLYVQYNLTDIILKQKATIMNTITKRHEGVKKAKKVIEKTLSCTVVNEILDKNKIETKSVVEGKTKSDLEKKQEWDKKIAEIAPNLSAAEKKEVVADKINAKIDVEFSSWPGEIFFTTETVGETLVITLNMKHPFYTELYQPLEKKNPELINAIQLLIMAFARADDELYIFSDPEMLEKLRSHWGSHLRDFLKKLQEDL